MKLVELEVISPEFQQSEPKRFWFLPNSLGGVDPKGHSFFNPETGKEIHHTYLVGGDPTHPVSCQTTVLGKPEEIREKIENALNNKE